MDHIVRRMCFDIESSYFKHPGTGIGDPKYHRDLIIKSNPLFHGGVIYDEINDNYHEFTRENIESMIRFLSNAEELISHSGRRHDLPIIDSCSNGMSSNLYLIPHWDLLDMGNWKSLDDLSDKYIRNILPDIIKYYKNRCNQNDMQHPGEPWGSGTYWSPANKQGRDLAKADYDVRRTYAVWKTMIFCHSDLKPSDQGGN